MHDDDGLVATWARGPFAYPPLSEHAGLEVTEAFWREKTGKEPLKDGEPMPGCTCTLCVGDFQRSRALKKHARGRSYFNMERTVLDGYLRALCQLRWRVAGAAAPDTR